MHHFSPEDSYSNFVLNFRTEEIDAVKNDINLHREGYLFFYAIDTYDIINHYLPYTDSSFFSSGNKNQIAQKAIAYDKFFTSFLTNKLIVLDEYKQELFAAKSYIEKQIKNTGILRSNISALVSDIEKMQKGDSGDRERIRKNVELILFLLILSENRGNIHSNFFEFLKLKLSIFKFDTANTRQNELLDSIFFKATPSPYVEKVYDDFVTNVTYELSRFESDFERYTYLDNTYRDIEAIDRLTSINTVLKHNHPDEKVKFLYLSSAPFKSRRILSTFDRVTKTAPGNSEGLLQLDFHRSIFQCFLFKLLTEEFPENNDQTPLSILDALKEIVQEKTALNSLEVKQQRNQVAGKNDAIIQTFKGILDRYSSNIDNHFYFKIYNKYKTIFELAENGHNDQIVDIINHVQKYIKEEKIITDGNDLFYNIGQYKQTFVLSKIFEGDQSAIFIHLSFGKDIVRDSFHHLPYLLFLQNNPGQSLLDDLYPLLNTLSDFSTYRFERVDEITPYLRKIFSRLSVESASLSNIAVRLLLTSYLYLLCGSKAQNNQGSMEDNFFEKELTIIEALKKQKRIMESSALSIVRNSDENRIDIQKKQISLKKEFDYVLLWLLRRTQQFQEAIELGNELVLNSDDGRFAHGLALAYGSRAYGLVLEGGISDNRSESIINLLESSFIYLNKSKTYYLNALQEVDDPYAQTLIKKTLMAVNNSIADESLRRFEQLGLPGSEQSLLEIARINIEEIKTLCKETGINYDQLAIYNYTEAELLYYEADVHMSKTELKSAHIKIMNATDIVNAVKFQKNAMNEVFKKVEKNINALRYDILKKQGMIK